MGPFRELWRDICCARSHSPTMVLGAFSLLHNAIASINDNDITDFIIYYYTFSFDFWLPTFNFQVQLFFFFKEKRHHKKNIDTLKKKVPATSDSAIVADDRRLQSAQLQLQDVSRSTGRAAHDSRLQCPRNTSSLLPHTTTCTGASSTTAEILSILGEERDKQKRASNFVLHGLAEGAGATDREEVLKLFPHLAEATEIFRLGREAPSPTSKPCPLLVKTTRPYKSEAFRAKN